jgi:hypothetical protein
MIPVIHIAAAANRRIRFATFLNISLSAKIISKIKIALPGPYRGRSAVRFLRPLTT